MYRKLVFTLLGFGLTLSGAPIRAQTAPAPEMTYESVKADYLKADAELTKVYEETLARLTPSEREELKGYQRAWIKLREDRTAGMQDGIGKWNDRASFTKERIDFLKAYSAAEGAYPPPGYTLGETERDQTGAPEGDLLIENYNGESVNYAGQPILTHQTWVVSRKDPSQRHRLPVYRDQSGEDLNSRCAEMSHYISPDQRWILRLQETGGIGSAYLFRRKSGVQFEKATIKPFDDMAWDFLARCFAHSKKNKGLERDQLRRWDIAFDSWMPDSRKLRVSLSGHEKRAWLVNGWSCDYDLQKGRFEVPASLVRKNDDAVESFSER